MQKEPAFYAVRWRIFSYCKTHDCETWCSCVCNCFCDKERRTERRYSPVYRFDGTWRWLFQPFGEYRQGTSYRRNPEHQKKETSDEAINKTIWRNSKKDWRHDCHSWKRGNKSRGEHLKRARQNERHWVKHMLQRERYEDIPIKDGTMFYDPWDWD